MLKCNQARRNGFEHGGDGKTPVTFKPFVVQTLNLTYSFENGKPNPKIWWSRGSMAPYVPAGLCGAKLQNYWCPIVHKTS